MLAQQTLARPVNKQHSMRYFYMVLALCLHSCFAIIAFTEQQQQQQKNAFHLRREFDEKESVFQLQQNQPH